ncbi:MAG: hypothetical protein KJZ70_07340 [Bryobacterales bacterium]|nr:hypothetical protein [Bryobacterales bacterium]
MADARPKTASDVLQSYRRWKEEGAALKAQAQNLLVERFHELLREAQQVQHDLYEDFGHTVKFPVNPKFAKKGKTRPPARKPLAGAPVAAPPAPSSTPAGAGSPSAAHAPSSRHSAVQKPSGGASALRVSPAERAPRAASSKRPSASRADQGAREIERLTRQVEKARERLAEAKESGGPVKIQNAEDRLYELSDELRLLTDRQAE